MRRLEDALAKSCDILPNFRVGHNPTNLITAAVLEGIAAHKQSRPEGAATDYRVLHLSLVDEPGFAEVLSKRIAHVEVDSSREFPPIDVLKRRPEWGSERCKFDAVVLSGVAEKWKRPEVMEWAHHVLRPGGALFWIYHPKDSDIFERAMAKKTALQCLWGYNRGKINEHRLLEAVRKCGLHREVGFGEDEGFDEHAFVNAFERDTNAKKCIDGLTDQWANGFDGVVKRMQENAPDDIKKTAALLKEHGFEWGRDLVFSSDATLEAFAEAGKKNELELGLIADELIDLKANKPVQKKQFVVRYEDGKLKVYGSGKYPQHIELEQDVPRVIGVNGMVASVPGVDKFGLIVAMKPRPPVEKKVKELPER